MWDKFKGYIFGAILGAAAITSIVALSLTHTLSGIFIGWWFGTAFAYLGGLFAFEQHDKNKKFKSVLVKLDKDLLEHDEQLDKKEYDKVTDIIVNNHYAKNYIERLTDKKTQEKIENRPRSVDACIIDTEIEHEDNIEL